MSSFSISVLITYILLTPHFLYMLCEACFFFLFLRGFFFYKLVQQLVPLRGARVMVI